MAMAFAPRKTHFESAGKEPAERATEPEGHQSGSNEDGTGEDVSHLDIHDVVQQHGPAHALHIAHSEGAHHVHSVHGEGMHHHSEHDSREAAHQHAKVAAGMDDQDEAATGGKHSAEEEDEQVSIPGIRHSDGHYRKQG